MCPPPCGPRRSYLGSYVPSEKISKDEVESLILSGDFICSCRFGGSDENQEYEGCLHNLQMILRDGKTRVRVVGSRSKDYLPGFRTVVMTAPCFPATFILRTNINN